MQVLFTIIGYILRFLQNLRIIYYGILKRRVVEATTEMLKKLGIAGLNINCLLTGIGARDG